MTPEQYSCVARLVSECLPQLQWAIDNKNHKAVMTKLLKFGELAFSEGLQAGLGSEAKAWAEVNRLEDLLVDLLRYAPDSGVAIARKVEQSV